MPALTVFKAFKDSVYSGTNGAAIAEEMKLEVASDDGQTLVIEGMAVPVGHHLVWTWQVAQGQLMVAFEGVFSDETFLLLYS